MTAAPAVNIGPRQRRWRLLAGLVALAVAFGALAVLVAIGVHRVWRAVLFVPFWVGALGLAQARART